MYSHFLERQKSSRYNAKEMINIIGASRPKCYVLSNGTLGFPVT
jgi:hypothetical protein